ncbi:hypothetical protein VitviT2T_014113 [Vitis vinifera]|uniref:Protein kinase domain-containing protein n=1 Tax=Vitis vinifera TaxID=29760 RepID=A0ABY9CIP9_VITVI|nr:hypothetical protein VitviT2T_014113 [Vitis vinifera]
MIVRALCHMHERGANHCDLKPDNVLDFPDRDGGMVVKVADLGLARRIGEQEVHGVQFRGTPVYMGEEILRSLGDCLQCFGGHSSTEVDGSLVYNLILEYARRKSEEFDGEAQRDGGHVVKIADLGVARRVGEQEVQGSGSGPSGLHVCRRSLWLCMSVRHPWIFGLWDVR